MSEHSESKTESGAPLIDISFDFQSDTPSGRDPDALSPTLRKYHRYLWSKRLPTGQMFELDSSDPHRYLVYHAESGDLVLTSDSIIPTFTRWERMKPITSQFPEGENDAFRNTGYTLGGMMIWPGVPTNGEQTINQERGFNGKIADRMDLTLECIRRYYLGEDNPMGSVLTANGSYFSLFQDFRGFTDFFLFQDLVTEDYTSVRFFMPFDNFNGPPTPKDVDAYKEYRRRTLAFVEARNRRINSWQTSRTT